MTAIELIAALHSRGVMLEPRGDKLRYYPRNAVTDRLLREMFRHKAAILSLLTSGSSIEMIPCPTDGDCDEQVVIVDDVGVCGGCGMSIRLVDEPFW